MERKKHYTVIDLFAGCGGLSLGLYLSGWQGVFAIEKNQFAFETLKSNLIKNKQHFHWPSWLPQTSHDINEILKNYKNQLNELRGKVDLVAGGPPCQGFSTAGKRIEEDIRNNLVFSYIEFIKLIEPKIILFENVKGFTYAFDKKKGKVSIPYSKKVIDALVNLRYKTEAYIIDFSKYGIPQKRNRFILIGSKTEKNKSINFKELLELKKSDFLLEKGITANITVKEAISDLLRSNGQIPTPDRKGFMSGKYGKAESEYQKLLRGNYAKEHNIPDSHSFAKHSLLKEEYFKKLLNSNQHRGKRIAETVKSKLNIKQRSLTILDPNSVSPTITSHPDDYLHYSEPRIMTVRECARIQSFPDWYEIKEKYTTGGSMRKIEVPRYSQIGNAIPPLFAELAGLALKDML
ncbi:MAG: DNA cytosine methyltransferase [Treponema lecithinolyticum]|uniref:DNA cytosine methyltransferase n=1 Tax=Treponema lecithinolyticum TaxID=53418 RepID=UPI003FA2435A